MALTERNQSLLSARNSRRPTATLLSDAENASGHHNLQNTFEVVVSSIDGLESDLNSLRRFARHLETKSISCQFRPDDLEVAAQFGLVAFNVEKTTIVVFKLALNQKIAVVAFLAFLSFLDLRKRDLEILATRTCDRYVREGKFCHACTDYGFYRHPVKTRNAGTARPERAVLI